MQFEMPKPGTEHRKLATLPGTWAGEEKLFPSPWDPKGGTAVGRLTAKVDIDGFFVTSDYVEERDGQVTYRGHGVYGWDPAEKCYTMHWFDSMGSGSPEPAKGQWEGNQLVFSATSPKGQSRYIYTFEGQDTQKFRIAMSQDGKTWAPMMEGKYSRK